MKLGIVTDSTCDIPPFLVEQHELEVVPCILVIDGKEYVDGKDITREEFYRFSRPRPRPRSGTFPPGTTLSLRRAAVTISSLFTRLAP
jgi:fatty acid-binding protein DegV